MHKSMILAMLLEMKTAQPGLGELYQRDWEEKQAVRAAGSRGLASPSSRQQGGIREQKAA